MNRKRTIFIWLFIVGLIAVSLYIVLSESLFTNEQTKYVQATYILYNVPRVEIKFQYPRNTFAEEISAREVWYWKTQNNPSCNPKLQDCIESIKSVAMWYECNAHGGSDVQTKDSYKFSRFIKEDPANYVGGGIVNINGVEVVRSRYSDIGSTTEESHINIDELSFVVADQVCFIGANKTLSYEEKEAVFGSFTLSYDATMK